MAIQQSIKTRFAPSPTGLMHFGNIRTALFNYLFAKGVKGKFLLRIEDTDQLRSAHHFKETIFNDLHWLFLDWDEGPKCTSVQTAENPEISYFQSDRQPIYDHFYQKLEKDSLIYPCFCTEEELAIHRKIQLSKGQPPRYSGTCSQLTPEQISAKIAKGIPHTFRFRIPKGRTLVYNDLIKGEQRFETDHIGDFIIRRGDGSASFMFCNAVDDAVMGVTHALRGEDHLTNTPRQILLLEAMQLKAPQYGHFPTILGPDGRPLSKRNGSRSIEEMREEGFLPIAILNYLSRLGHTITNPKFMSLQDLIATFTLSHISHAPAHYDEAQLRHWQKEAIMHMDNIALSAILPKASLAKVQEKGLSEKDFVSLIQHNILFPKESEFWANVLLCENLEYAPLVCDAFQKQKSLTLFKEAIKILKNNPTLNYLDFIRTLQSIVLIKGKDLFMPIRLSWTGVTEGPELEKIYNLMGTEWVIKRFMSADLTLRV